MESPRIEINHPNQNEQIARLEKAIAELAAVVAKQKEIGAPRNGSPDAENGEFVSRLEKIVESLASVASRPLRIDVTANMPERIAAPAAVQMQRLNRL